MQSSCSRWTPPNCWLAVAAAAGGAGSSPSAALWPAIAATAALLLTQRRANAPVAGDQQQQEAYFAPVQGVPRGDDVVGAPVTNAEALRRCRLRLPDMKGPLSNTVGGYRIGDQASTGKGGNLKVGDKMRTVKIEEPKP